MTTDDRSLERAARSWLEAGPTQAPDRAVEAALERIRTTPQERHPLIPWRTQSMTPITRWLVGAAAATVVLVAGVLLLRPVGSDTAGGPTQSAGQPSASASLPPVTPSPSAGATTSAQTVVDASAFVAPFRMTWDVKIDRTNIRTDVVDIFVGTSGLNVLHINRVARDACLSNQLQSAPVRTPRAFMDWLGTVPRTTHGPITSLTVGGHPALERIVTVGSLTGCIDPGYLHSGIGEEYGIGSNGGYFMTAGEVERWIVLDDNGTLVALVVWPNDRPLISSAADRAISTMTFTH